MSLRVPQSSINNDLKKRRVFEASYSSEEDERIRMKEVRMKKEIRKGDKDDDKIK